MKLTPRQRSLLLRAYNARTGRTVLAGKGSVKSARGLERHGLVVVDDVRGDMVAKITQGGREYARKIVDGDGCVYWFGDSVEWKIE